MLYQTDFSCKLVMENENCAGFVASSKNVVVNLPYLTSQVRLCDYCTGAHCDIDAATINRAALQQNNKHNHTVHVLNPSRAIFIVHVIFL